MIFKKDIYYSVKKYPILGTGDVIGINIEIKKYILSNNQEKTISNHHCPFYFSKNKEWEQLFQKFCDDQNLEIIKKEVQEILNEYKNFGEINEK